MEAAQETRVYTVPAEVVDPLTREIKSRVRLTFSVEKRRWWEFKRNVSVSVTGPVFALEQLPKIVEQLKLEARADWEW